MQELPININFLYVITFVILLLYVFINDIIVRYDKNGFIELTYKKKFWCIKGFGYKVLMKNHDCVKYNRVWCNYCAILQNRKDIIDFFHDLQGKLSEKEYKALKIKINKHFVHVNNTYYKAEHLISVLSTLKENYNKYINKDVEDVEMSRIKNKPCCLNRLNAVICNTTGL